MSGMGHPAAKLAGHVFGTSEGQQPIQSLVSKDGGRAIVKVNPFRCRVWALHDRLEDYVTEESCRAEIESFKTHGQLVPALGRPLSGDPGYDVEIVYGSRRLFVARYLGMQLHVELRKMSDKEAAAAMDIENRHRTDISPYERGLIYHQWLREGLFSSQDEIARALDVSSSQISRLLKLAQLPAVIVNAFESPLDIREGWGVDLHKAWQNEKLRQLVADRARALAVQSPRSRATQVYERLLAPSGAVARLKKRRSDEVVLGRWGGPLFRIWRQRNSVAFLVPAAMASPDMLEKARGAFQDILEDVRVQMATGSGKPDVTVR